ncbi:MAG: biopolymer transport protein ExbD [Alphaproteobacteria bacterium]|nr:biopolymer transport protein ExbD [Alphaproteobacteria bacterium]
MGILDQPLRRSRKMSMTSMIDVVFLLLIFFMLINTFGSTQVLRFATPAGERKSIEKDFNLAPVFIRADNSIDIDGKTFPADALKGEMQKIKSRAAEVTLMIVVEPGAKNQSLIHVIEAARSTGLKNIAMKKLKDAEAILSTPSNGGAGND